MKVIFFILFTIATLTSCSSQYMKYESWWLIDTFEVYGEDATNLIVIYNFSINVKLSSATPPTVQDDPNIRRKVTPCKINFFTKSGKDYIEFYDHYFFEGIYEIKCLDDDCCRISIEDDRIYLELVYNGPLTLRHDSRECP